MNFWDRFEPARAASLAIIDENGRHVSYAELDSRVDAIAAFLQRQGTRQFGMLFMSNKAAAIATYLGCLRAGHVPLLLPDNLNADLADALINHYRPDWIAGPDVQGETLPGTALRIAALPDNRCAATPAPELGLLLSTSGSTGSPKLVRLSYAALQANASSIAAYMGLEPDERAMTVLPPTYSYGLSIVNSHLAAGAALVLSDASVISPDFLDTVRKHEVTSLSGVPTIYQMLFRTGFPKQELPSLRKLTQAGGKLDDKLTRLFGELAAQRGWQFYVMYGQTEATARISYVPPARLLDKIGAIGIPIPGGELSVDPQNGELVYRGPNVMMGYALERSHLALGDELGGELRTGDLGRQDEEGYFYVVGRLKRFVKLAGNRIGLDEVESMLQAAMEMPVAVGGRDERMVVWLETAAAEAADQARRLIADTYGVHHSLCRLRTVERLPLLASGKKDYVALMADT